MYSTSVNSNKKHSGRVPAVGRDSRFRQRLSRDAHESAPKVQVAITLEEGQEDTEEERPDEKGNDAI